MTGVLESVLSELQSIKGVLQGIAAQAPATTAATTQPVQVAQLQPVQAAADPLSLTATQPVSVTNAALTEDTLMSLIEPHLDNITIKTGLQGVLAQLGIPRLPEARPDQYQDLFNRFTAVIQQHTTGSLNSAVAGGSII